MFGAFLSRYNGLGKVLTLMRLISVPGIVHSIASAASWTPNIVGVSGTLKSVRDKVC